MYDTSTLNYLIDIANLRVEISKILVSATHLADSLREPLIFADYGEEILDLTKMPLKSRDFSRKKAEKLFQAYSALYHKLEVEMLRLCEISMKKPGNFLNPRQIRWYEEKTGLLRFDAGVAALRAGGQITFGERGSET